MVEADARTVWFECWCVNLVSVELFKVESSLWKQVVWRWCCRCRSKVALRTSAAEYICVPQPYGLLLLTRKCVDWHGLLCTHIRLLDPTWLCTYVSGSRTSNGSKCAADTQTSKPVSDVVDLESLLDTYLASSDRFFITCQAPVTQLGKIHSVSQPSLSCMNSRLFKGSDAGRLERHILFTIDI